MLIVLAAFAQDPPCGDPEALITEVEAAAFELRVEDAQSALAEVERSFECALVGPPELARFWNAEGALALLANDATAAARAFRAARNVGPPPDPNYGKRALAAAQSAGPAEGIGTLDLSPRPTVFGVRVDGVLGAVPAEVDAGDHLIQVVDGSRVAFGSVVRVSAGEAFVLNASFEEPLPVVRVQPEPVPPPRASRKRPKGLLVASGALLVGGATSAGLALRERNGVIPKTEDLDTLEAAWTRQRAFGGVAYGLWGGAALAATAFFVW